MNHETQNLIFTTFFIFIGFTLLIFIILGFFYKKYKQVSSIKQLEKIHHKAEILTHDKDGVPELIKINKTLRYI